MKKSLLNSKWKITAQAMVEFALALPVLLLVVYGLLETGRLLFIYASVVTAARQAARYASASGDNGSGTNYYNDCAGIRAAANKVAFIQTFSSIDIKYDNGPSPTWQQSGCPISTANSTAHPQNGDRVGVTVSAQFSPIVPLVPFRPFTITSTSNRSLLINAYIAVTPQSQGGPTGGTALALAKTADTQTYTQLGQVIHYHYTIWNIGTIPITGPFKITDDHIGTFTCGGVPSTLPGPSPQYSCSPDQPYTITLADLALSQVVNTATAINGDGSVVSNSASATVTFVPAPHITLAKAGTAPNIVAAGNQVTYTFTITNDGNVPLTPPYTITDPLLGGNWSCPSTALSLQSSVTCTGQYTIKASDLNAGRVTNTATASAQYGGQTITSAPASATVGLQTLALTITANPTSVSAAGAVVTYTYTVTNRTTSSMGAITITDSRGANKLACLGSLAAGATVTCQNTNAYTVTQADIDSATGQFSDTGTASTQISGVTVTSAQAGVNVTVVQSPAITLLKSGPTITSGADTVGQVITYTYLVTNTGNVTLTPTTATPLTVTDSDIRVGTNGAACTITSGSLAPGGVGKQTCTATLTLQQADIDAGSVTSTGTTNATFASTALTASSTFTLITYASPRLVLVKTPSVTYFTATGQQITYTYGIQNTGGVPLTITGGYSLTDNKTGSIPCPGASLTTPATVLNLGALVTCGTRTYTVTAADVTNRGVTNTLNVTAGSTNPATTVAQVQKTVTLLSCDATHPTSNPNNPIGNGSNTTWGILNNTGTDLHITGGSMSWGGNASLLQIILGGQSIWLGTGASSFTLPTAGWPVLPNNATTTMAMKFSGNANKTSVYLTFQEAVGGVNCTLTSP